MQETQKHLELKQKAKEILKTKGFLNNEIFEEYCWKTFIIDVAGIKKDRKLFIECGVVTRHKLKMFNEVNIPFIHLPYLYTPYDTITITISKVNWKKLTIIKVKEGIKTLDDVITHLLDQQKKGEIISKTKEENK